MTKIDLIKKIEEKRSSRVITYLTSDRPGPLNARIAGDIIPMMQYYINLSVIWSISIITSERFG